MTEKPVIIATRGSALALTQANLIFDACREVFPRLAFEVKIIKTTGDKLQTASLAKVIPFQKDYLPRSWRLPWLGKRQIWQCTA